MIRALDRKLLRDMTRMKGQLIAVVALVACGVASFVSSMSTYASMLASQSAYYDRYAFAHVFDVLKRAPESVRTRLEEISGVQTVETRVVYGATIRVPGMHEPAYGLFVSIPDTGEPRLNQLYFRQGRNTEPHVAREVVVNEAFALAHGFVPGDKVTAIINGRQQQMTIVGIALSPEFVYAVKDGAPVPDDKHFGVFWIRRDELASSVDMDGAFNDVVFSLTRGASEAQVITDIDDVLRDYGGLGAHGRYEQVSNRYLTDEITSLRATAVFVPIIFLGVAAFLLNVVVSRMVAMQREQIATLKALGYANGALAAHYAKLVALVAMLGVGLGTAIGAFIGHAETRMYTDFFHFPALVYRLDAWVVAVAVSVSLASALGGVGRAVYRAVRLPPADAMRPASPPRYRKLLIERFGVQRFLSPVSRMILRNLDRHRWRAVMSTFGIAWAVGILLVGWYFVDAVDYMMDVQFRFAERQDVTVSFSNPVSDRAVGELEHIDGVIRAEPFRALPVKLRAGHRTRRTGLMGLDPDATLRQLLDVKLVRTPIPEDGVLMTDELAKQLHLRPGDLVTLEVLEGQRRSVQVPLRSVVAEPMGVSVYASLAWAQRLVGEPHAISGARLEVDKTRLEDVCQKLADEPQVSGVARLDDTVKTFEGTSRKYLVVFAVILVLFAGVIVVGLVYNSGRVALAERERELASLRIIGFTRGEVKVVLLGELAVYVLAAIPVGFALGHACVALVATTFSSELYRLPVIIDPSTYAASVIVLAVAATATAWAIQSRLNRLDMVAALKSRE